MSEVMNQSAICFGEESLFIGTDSTWQFHQLYCSSSHSKFTAYWPPLLELMSFWPSCQQRSLQLN
uniref:Uncharacterized protein n=2 Tax=Anguilla anguilla TaxID=7936 RepID=A0A0E9R7K1_ANGAN